MKKLETKYLSVEAFHAEDYFELVWFSESENMTDEIYKEVLTDVTHFLVHHALGKLLMDSKNLRFAITPELQDWTNQNVFTHTIKAGLLKNAILVSESLLSELAVEQTYGDSTQKVKEYFHDKEEALKWLLA